MDKTVIVSFKNYAKLSSSAQVFYTVLDALVGSVECKN